MADLTHLDAAGNARMVDVSDKQETVRQATAEGCIVMDGAALAAVRDGKAAKGNVLAVARIAGIMAAKRTSEIIPLCHPLQLSGCTVDFAFEDEGIRASATVRIGGKTGVEMEALTAVSAALGTGAMASLVYAITRGGEHGWLRGQCCAG